MGNTNINQVCFDLATADFERNLYNSYLAKWKEKQRKSPYFGTELERFGLLNTKHLGRVFELAALGVLSKCGFDVRDVANDNDYPGVDILVNGHTVDVKGARYQPSRKSYMIDHIDPKKASIVFGVGLKHGHIMMVAFEPAKVDLTLGKGDEAYLYLSATSNNKWLKHGGSVKDALLILANLVGAPELHERIETTASTVRCLDGYYEALIKFHAETFEIPTQELDGLHSVLQHLNANHVGDTFEAVVIELLQSLNYKARAATAEEQGTHGDILVTLRDGVEVWLELKMSSQNSAVRFNHINPEARFEYFIGLHVAKGQRRFYIIPNADEINDSLPGVYVDSNNQNNLDIRLGFSAADNPKHPLYKYQYTLRAGLEKLDRLLKGNT